MARRHSIGPHVRDLSANETGMLRLRPEVRAVPVRRGLQLSWRIKHALTLEHFEVADDEWFILCQLDGKTDAETILLRYNERFLPRQLTAAGLQAFLQEAYDAGIVESTASRQAEVHARRRRDDFRRRAALAPLSLLGLRLPLLDPSRLLKALRPASRVLFSPWFAGAVAAAGLLLVVLILGRFSALESRLPKIESLISLTGVAKLLVVWIVVKVLHELGHAMACDCFGAECHEAGLMVIGVAPVMYCDVTDAWSLPSRVQRAVVSAAGIYVELIVSVLCGYLWLGVGPGALQDLLFRVAAVCSASTLAFNLNPLLRLDGYYVLSDLGEIPNLHERSRRVAWGSVLRWLTRGQVAPRSAEPCAFRLAAFAVASTVYQAFVAAVIGWIAWRFFDDRGAPAIGATIAILTIAASCAGVLRFSWQLVRSSRFRRSFSQLRAALLVSLAAAGLAASLLWPLPSSAPAGAMVEPVGARPLFVRTAGRLYGRLPYGTAVKQGQIIARIEQPELELRATELSGKLRELLVEREAIGSRQVSDPGSAARLRSLAAAEATTREQLEAVKRESASLTIRSPLAGILLPPSPRHGSPEEDHELPEWVGTPLAPDNDGCWVDSGTELGQVSPNTGYKVRLLIDQADLRDVAPGAQVRICLDESPAATLLATITQVGWDCIEAAPPTLTAAAEAALNHPFNADRKPAKPLYFAEAKLLDDAHERLIPRTGGVAKIETDRRPLWQRMWKLGRQLWYAM